MYIPAYKSMIDFFNNTLSIKAAEKIMAELDHGKLLMLAEQGAELDGTDCWKKGKSHWYYKWRMDTVKYCWMMRTSIPIFLILLLFLNLCLATLTLATPAHYTTTAASHYDIDATTSIDISYAPTEEDGDTFIHEPPVFFDPTKPTPLSFIKNAKCKLHKENGKTIPRRCGLRELDLPDNESGVEYWNPQICRSARCQCVATKEIRKKAKRSIANNKTIIEYRRFKLFECV